MKTLKYSVTKRHAYKKKCKELNVKFQVPILDVPTRWNSTYAMLFRVLQMQKVSSKIF